MSKKERNAQYFQIIVHFYLLFTKNVLYFIRGDNYGAI